MTGTRTRLMLAGATALGVSMLAVTAWAQGSMAPQPKQGEPVIPQGVTTGSSGISKSTSQGPATLPAGDPNRPVGTGSGTIRETTASGPATLPPGDPTRPVGTGSGAIRDTTARGSGTMPSGSTMGGTASSGTMTSPGAPSGGSGTMATTAGMSGGGGNQVMRAQQALIADGAKIKADGKMGPKTAAALRAYQGKHGLRRTGKLDAETARSLGI